MQGTNAPKQGRYPHKTVEIDGIKFSSKTEA
jgi:hypothetical protein